MDTLRFTTSDPVPAGMMQTLQGDVLPDCPRSHLTGALQEAYALDGHVDLQVDGGTPYRVALSREMMADTAPRELGGVELGDDDTVRIERTGEYEYRLTELGQDGGDVRTTMLKVAYSDYFAMPAMEG